MTSNGADLTRIALFAALAALSGCAAFESDGLYAPTDVQSAQTEWPTGDPAGPVLDQDVVVVDDDPCVVGVDVPDDREVLTFDFACDPVGRGFEPGAVVVGSAGGGYLRRVVSVQYEGSRVTAWTEEASLADAIVEGGFSLSLNGGGERGLINLDNTVLFADEVYGSDVLFKLNRADLDIHPRIDIDGHWADGGVETFDFDTSLELSGEISALLSSSNGLRHKKDIDVWETSWPFATAVGPLPVVGDVGVRASIGYRLAAPGQTSVTAGAGGEIRWGSERRYREGEGWTEDPMNLDDWRMDPPEVEVTARAVARVYVRVTVFVRFYGSAGPELSADLATRVSAEADCDGVEWDADASLIGRARVTMSILDKFTPTKTFGTVDLTADLAAGTLPWPIDVPLPCQQEEIRCGDVVQGDTGDGGWRPQLDGYSCNVGNYDAPEAIYQWTATTSGPVEWALIDAAPTDVNHDVLVLDGALGLLAADCTAWGANSVGFDAVAGHTYFLVIDGYNDDAGPFAAELACPDDDPADDGDWPF